MSEKEIIETEDELTRSESIFQQVLGSFSTVYKKIDRFFNKGGFEKFCREPKTYYYFFGTFFSHTVVLVGRYIYSMFWVKGRVISFNPLYIIIFGVLPFGVWAMSTICEKFDTRGTKRLLLWYCVINLVMIIGEGPWMLIYKYLVFPKVLSIPIRGSIEPSLVLSLARICLAGAVALPSLVILKPLTAYLNEYNTVLMINKFKLNKVLDLRPNKNQAYDFGFMKDAEGYGNKLTMHEHDLYVHLLLIGASGVGKTTTSINPMIINILETKVKNRECRQALLEEMLRHKKAYIKGPVKNPTEYDIAPFAKYKDEWEDVYREYPDAGLTVISPNVGIGNAVVRLCGDCDVNVNMIDPEKHYKQKHVTHVGINPLYVTPGLDDVKKVESIVSNARAFSETLLSVNEASGVGGGEQYFKDLNTSVTTNVAGTVMTYASLTGQQALLGDVQQCIKDFKKLYPMVVKINEAYELGLKICNPNEVQQIEKGKKNAKHEDSLDGLDVNNDITRACLDASESKGMLADGNAEMDAIMRIRMSIDSYKRPIRNMIQYVNDELFLNGKIMFDQSRGLRNIIDEMLELPVVYDLLNPEGPRIDFDDNFKCCNVTVVNTAIGKVNKKSSSAIGLFYMLCYSNAVKRRPNNDERPRDSQPHFLIMDEAANYLHWVMSESVNLWRQYKCASVYAFQALSQMDSNPTYKDIKGSLLQVGNIVAYGRLGEDEMATFQNLAGEKRVTEYQNTLSQASLMDANPSGSASVRTQEKDEAVATATDLRYKDFKEATWFRYIDSNVLPPIPVMLDFADMDVFKKRKKYKSLSFNKYKTKEPITEEAVLSEEKTDKKVFYDKEVKENTPFEESHQSVDRNDDGSWRDKDWKNDTDKDVSGEATAVKTPSGGSVEELIVTEKDIEKKIAEERRKEAENNAFNTLMSKESDGSGNDYSEDIGIVLDGSSTSTEGADGDSDDEGDFYAFL